MVHYSLNQKRLLFLKCAFEHCNIRQKARSVKSTRKQAYEILAIAISTLQNQFHNEHRRQKKIYTEHHRRQQSRISSNVHGRSHTNSSSKLKTLNKFPIWQRNSYKSDLIRWTLQQTKAQIPCIIAPSHHSISVYHVWPVTWGYLPNDLWPQMTITNYNSERFPLYQFSSHSRAAIHDYPLFHTIAFFLSFHQIT